MSLAEGWRAAFRAHRTQRAGRRLKTELEFLPAALELMETPPSPAARGLLWGTLGFVALALAWAEIGELDIIAVARGRIVPSGAVRVVQPAETAVVRRLLVQDGLRVRKGQLLIELDTADVDAERERVRNSRLDASLAAARAQALLEAAARGAARPRSLPSRPDWPEGRVAEANLLMEAEYRAYRSELATRDAEAVHLRAQQATTLETLRKLEALHPLYEQRAADLGRLLDKGYVPRHDVLEAENRRIETGRELEVQRRRLDETYALVAQQREERAAAEAGFVRRSREALLQAGQQQAQLAQEEARLRARQERLALRAPVDGTVQQLALHTEGGVATAAQPLLVVVPANAPLEVEALVENRDIGFVAPGQVADVKVEAFPFTRYGVLRGRVAGVSPDAVADEKRGLQYQARVLLDRASIGVEGRQVALAPGMAVSVEIKTGRRRIIDYFLGPVLQRGSESVHER